ncbi:MAG: hypothetical protein HY965_07910 [Ignavibacteriales bacterium]|nr:hypothetical protein [Ignavibacteriales bacterium]
MANSEVFKAVTMFPDRSTIKGKYARVLLRENFREIRKVTHRTVGNISSCTAAEIKAIALALSKTILFHH